VTPDGRPYDVRYVPREAIRLAAAAQPHNYVAVAVAFPGWIWAADDVPCGTIPWEHEELHLDGWVHDPNGRWIGRTAPEVREARQRPSPAPWFIVKTGDGYRVVGETRVAALPRNAD
jgi:hypothetical protein